MSRLWKAAVALAMLAAGCGKEPPSPAVVVVKPQAKIAVAPECTQADPGWVELPVKDIRRSELLRNVAENRARFATLAGRRTVCRASVQAHGL